MCGKFTVKVPAAFKSDEVRFSLTLRKLNKTRVGSRVTQ